MCQAIWARFARLYLRRIGGEVRVSIKSLYNFKNLLQRQMKRQISGNYYKIRRIYLSLFFLPHLIHLYMGTINCTNHIKTVLDFVHDRCVPLGRPLFPLSNTVPVSINFLCHARIEGRDGGFLPYLILKFCWACRSDLVSINHYAHCAFSWGVTIL